MVKNNLLVAFAIIVTLVTVVMAQNLYAAPQIDVSGNKRTKTTYIQKLANICINGFDVEKINGYGSEELISQAKKLALRQCINNSGLFSDVVIYDFNEETISIAVTDKWSFLVLPSYSQAQALGDTGWGLLFFDFNFLGRGELLGAIFNRKGPDNQDSYSLIYDVPYIDKQGKYGFSVIALNRKQTFYNFVGDDWVFSTLEEFNFIWFKVKHRITSKFSLTYGFAPTYLGFSNARPKNGDTIKSDGLSPNIPSMTLNAEWSNVVKRYYYEKGFRSGATLFQQISNDDEMQSALLLEMYAGVPTYQQHVFQWGLLGGTRNNIKPYDAFRIGGELGARGIPADGAWSQQYLVSSFDYQLPIVQGRYGYWNIGPFIDVGYLWNLPNGPEKELSYYATGIVSYVHLRQVNVPAFGVSFSTNSRYQQDYLSLFIGFRL